MGGAQISFLHDLAALGTLYRHVVQLVGGGLDPHLQVEPLGQLLQPHARIRVAADEAEVVVAEPEDGGVVDHAAGLVADRGVDHLPDREPARVARDRHLDQRLGVRAEHLPLAQRREVHDHGLLAARPVLVDRALGVVALGQPVAAVVHEALGELAGARVERRFLGQHWLCLRGHAVGDGRREAVLGRVNAHVDVGDVPAVGRVDVVRACGRRAHQIRHRAHQDVVAGARPGLVGDDHVVVVHARVEEEVDGLPAGPRGDAVLRDLAVEVVGAVHVAGVAGVLVVARRAGEPERVVAADRVAHHLHERVHVHVEELAEEARLRIGRAHQRAGSHAVHAALETVLQLVLVEGQEVRALAPAHVDHLDELALAHLVGQRAGAVHAEVEARVGERRRQLGLGVGARRVALDLDHERGRRRVAVHEPAARSGHHQQRVALAHEGLRGPGRGRRARTAAGPSPRPGGDRLHGSSGGSPGRSTP